MDTNRLNTVVSSGLTFLFVASSALLAQLSGADEFWGSWLLMGLLAVVASTVVGVLLTSRGRAAGLGVLQGALVAVFAGIVVLMLDASQVG